MNNVRAVEFQYVYVAALKDYIRGKGNINPAHPSNFTFKPEPDKIKHGSGITQGASGSVRCDRHRGEAREAVRQPAGAP